MKVRYQEVSDKDKKAFKRYLSEDEELIVATGLSPAYLRQRFILQLFLPGALFILIGLAWAYFTPHSLSLGLSLGLLVAILYSLLQTWITYQAHRYLLTTRRVIIKNGFFSVKLASALYDKITHIEVDQGLVDRLLLHHGRVLIHTAGSNKDELVLKYIDSPIEFKNVLERLINRERSRYGREVTPLSEVEGELVED